MLYIDQLQKAASSPIADDEVKKKLCELSCLVIQYSIVYIQSSNNYYYRWRFKLVLVTGSIPSFPKEISHLSLPSPKESINMEEALLVSKAE